MQYKGSIVLVEMSLFENMLSLRLPKVVYSCINMSLEDTVLSGK